MPKQLAPLSLSATDRTTLDRISRSRREPAERVERARTLLLLDQGQSPRAIATQQGCAVATVYYRRARFLERGLASLDDLPRSGRPLTYDEVQRGHFVATAKTHPQQLGLPFGQWTLDRLVAYIHTELSIPISRSQLGDILDAEGLKWYQEKTYFTERPDPQFAEKRGPL